MLNKSAQMIRILALLAVLLILGPARLAAQTPAASDRPPGTVTPTTIHLAAAPNDITPKQARSTALLAPLANHAAFVVEIYPEENLHYIPDTASPETWLYAESVAGAAYFAGDFVGNDFGKLYVIDYNLNELHTLNTADGADTTIGACAPTSGQVWTGASGSAEGILYAASTNDLSSYLYTVDTGSGSATVVGQISNASAIIDIAINTAGEMYGVDISNDTLVQINPASGAGTVIGALGFDADYAQGMDFEDVSGVLYLAAYNVTTAQGELRIANTATGATSLVGAFPDGAQADTLAFTPPPVQSLSNPGFESGWAYWQTESYPVLSDTSHEGSWGVKLSGEECWAWQEVYIPSDALEISFGYWVTGLSSDTDWDNDILIGGIWDQYRLTKYVDVRYGLTYFYHNPMVWKDRIYRLEADELANIAGRRVLVGFQLTQDWNPGYHKTSTAWVDDVVLYMTRPQYNHFTYLPRAVK